MHLVLPPGFRHHLAALGAQRSERCCPDDELLEEWFQGFFRRIAGRERGEVFEVRGKGKCHLSADIGHVEFTGGQAQVFCRAVLRREPAG